MTPGNLQQVGAIAQISCQPSSAHHEDSRQVLAVQALAAARPPAGLTCACALALSGCDGRHATSMARLPSPLPRLSLSIGC
eukprot:CAMPEP_0206006644 /NCGR_PEP_ID=MMETSP1464-20131121/5300_1 /ASSEMBLY_ACC=CAM_ASM_001124 /TAXON_ID=119497 /ORGANISM="Exanthemachrysis gayraliae, Strain RCC1523" /LENGTH=80 /DNA_ID=CAMNT_0053380125 /DNA_START=364 /DNA_END=603 /DNA_ORIENTATION=-